MTKFCIDLEDMMLPDAIAAVVEAWLDAQSEDAVFDEKSHTPYQPGELIEVRDSAKEGSPWKRGWVIYRVTGARIGICEISKWCYVLNQPDYIANGGNPGVIFANCEKTGCTLKQPKNVRRLVSQPWEIEEANKLIA